MTQADIRANRLLASLPAAALERLRADLKPVTLEFGATLYRPGQRLRHVYFPLEAVVAKLYYAPDGKTTSIGVIGHEGIVGLSSFLGGLEITAETQVIGAGAALRLGIQPLEREFERGQEFQRTLLAFTQAFIAQTGQTVVCNRHHSVEQQLCSWLLLYLDRVCSNELHITHELIAGLLGVRREGISRAAIRLKQAGILDYKHGKITVLDRTRLNALACECHRIIHNAYDVTLPQVA